jgi:tyrosinase
MALRIRRSLLDIQADYDAGNTAELDNLMRAWHGIKKLPPTDPNSFFVIGGYHGEPFRGAGWGSAAYWGGYCNHGNVLFPTWHRAYLLRVEDALRSIAGCADVTLPFWDETSPDSLQNGIPWALTRKEYPLDGVIIPNPLRSFVFNSPISDHISMDDPGYGKPLNYETVRYPLSGLMGTGDLAKTLAHNAQYPNYDQNVQILNQNVIAWLTSQIVVNGTVIPTNVAKKYRDCLDAPNYTLFSNTSSAAEWNDLQPTSATKVVPIESPHNSIHLAVGGCEVPGYNRSPIDGANGDMGENDTAGLDPIFFFHHCFVDHVFWTWQKRNGHVDRLDIIDGYPGTNSVDGQNPTPGVAPNSWLTMESPLTPFTNPATGRWYTSMECANIETQLGYTYGPGSLDQFAARAAMLAAAPAHAAGPMVHVSGLSRSKMRGSFMVSAFANVDGKRYHLGTEAVLSRWHVEGCANCQTHLRVRAAFRLHGLAVAPDAIEVEVKTRDDLISAGTQRTPRFAAVAANVVGAAASAPKFKVEVR